MFTLHLRDIQVRHMETVLLPHPLLDLLICSALPEPRHIHVFQIEFHADLLTRYVSLGKLDNGLNVVIPNCSMIDSSSIQPFSYRLPYTNLE